VRANIGAVKEYPVRETRLIVLHAIWDYLESASLHIWAESSEQPLIVARRQGRPSKAEKTLAHPFALSTEDLREVMGEFAGSLQAVQTRASTLNLRLPSTSQGPWPSPELLLEQEGLSATAFQNWQVATLALNPDLALDFLSGLPDQPPRGSAFGAALCFWSTAARLAFELLSRQAYMPAVQEFHQEGIALYRAAWEAVLTGEDTPRLAELAGMMPPVCQAFLPLESRRASLPRQMLGHFLNQSIDAFVRASLTSTQLLLPMPAGRKTSIPVAEQWLQGLASNDPILVASATELKSFARSTRTWLEQLQPIEKDAPFRTCFRLDAPTEESTDWHISFYLQANDDRSLLVPAEKVWQERSGTLTFLQHSFENPQERLLTDLGRASRLFPSIEESLQTAHPQEMLLTTEQAYAFLRESAPLLEQSGFGVLVPPWWQKPTARLGVKLKVKPKVRANANVNSGLLGLDNLVTYDWTISVGDTVLSEQEFASLVNLKLPLIQVRGQWVELRPEEIERAIAFFQKKRQHGKMTLGEVLRTGLGQEVSEVGLPITEIEGEGWIEDLLGQLTEGAEIAPIDTPASFHGTLRPYQLKGVSWLAFLNRFGLGGCLADDMGLGKTIELITLLLHERETGTSGPALLICPMSIVGNWQRELQRFAPSLRVMVHHGHERLSGAAFLAEAQQHDVIITTYSLALRDREHLASLDWTYVVVDEAQNIKNEEARQTQAIKKLKATHRIALTGTPVENRLSELWSIMEFLNPGYLGTATDFRQAFALPIERNHDASRAAVLKNVIQPFVLRRLKTDKSIIADLPDKLEMKVFCNLTQEQATLYEAVVKEMLDKIEHADGLERQGLVLATLLKLKQICNHPAQFIADGSSLHNRSGKLERLEEMLEEVLAAGDKALIFSQFAEMGRLLRPYLQERLGREVLFLHGGTPKKMRDLMVQRFQEERRGAPLFLLSLKAGGVGLNLTGASHVFHFDRWWNPAVENQATDRAFRIGQQKNVLVHKFVCVGTLEERIDQMIEQKKELAESIVGSGENWLAEMSTSQLKELFALSREAIGE
jgi:SNF2 family DNA or RNA helicase